MLMDSFLNTVDLYRISEEIKKLLFLVTEASDAQHLSTELSVRFSDDRQAILTVSLVTDTSTLSAIGNDFGFEFLFQTNQTIGITKDVTQLGLQRLEK